MLYSPVEGFETPCGVSRCSRCFCGFYSLRSLRMRPRRYEDPISGYDIAVFLSVYSDRFVRDFVYAVGPVRDGAHFMRWAVRRKRIVTRRKTSPPHGVWSSPP